MRMILSRLVLVGTILGLAPLAVFAQFQAEPEQPRRGIDQDPHPISGSFETRGLFGKRTLGDMFRPKRGTMFDNGVPRTANGSLLRGKPLSLGTRFSTTPPPAGANRSAIPEVADYGRRPLPGQTVPRMVQQAPDRSSYPVPRGTFSQPRGPEPYFIPETMPQEERGPDVWFRSRPAAGTPGQPSIGANRPAPGGPILPGTRPPAQPSRTRDSLSSRISNNPAVKSISPLTVTVSEGRATIRGVVVTELDRRIAERLLLLEPNVRDVENRLTVGGQQPLLDIPGLE